MSADRESNTLTIELPEGFPAAIAETPEAFALELRRAAAIEWYREGRISQGTAAELAGMNRVDFLDELFRARVPACQVTVDELMEEVERASAPDRQRIATDPPGQGGTA